MTCHLQKKMKTYDAIRISRNLTNQKHDLKSRMISKTAPESAFMVLCLPEQSRKKDDWK
jgi:hypothetical protein